jgi:uncharacterized membrane protein
MPETDYAAFEGKKEGDRTFMYILYGLHTVAWASFGIFAVIALILNYIKRTDEQDAIYASHHNYMIATFWWTLAWLVLTAVLWLLIIPGMIAYAVIGLWYLYRCLRGLLRFSEGKPPF